MFYIFDDSVYMVKPEEEDPDNAARNLVTRSGETRPTLLSKNEHDYSHACSADRSPIAPNRRIRHRCKSGCETDQNDGRAAGLIAGPTISNQTLALDSTAA